MKSLNPAASFSLTVPHPLNPQVNRATEATTASWRMLIGIGGMSRP
jgi:hypothetical protein